MYAFPIRQFQDALDGILFGVENDMVCTIRFGQCGFLLGRGSANDGRTARFGVLREEQPEVACDGVNEEDVTLLDVVCFVHLRDDGQTCQEGSAFA